MHIRQGLTLALIVLSSPCAVAQTDVAQSLVNSSELGGEIQSALVAFDRIFLQRHGHHVLQLLGNVLAEHMNRRRRGVHNLMQQLLQIARTERT